MPFPFPMAMIGAGGASAAGYANLTFRESDTVITNAASYDPGDTVDIGTEAADRCVILAMAWGGSSVSVTGVDAYISGSPVSMTQIAHSTGANGGTAIFAISAPTGTYDATVVTMSTTATELHAAWWSVNMSNITAHDSASAAVTSGAGTLSALEIPNNGFAITAVYLNDIADRSHSINASYIEQVELFGEANSAFSQKEVVSSTSASVTSTWAASTSSGRIVGASWDGLGT